MIRRPPRSTLFPYTRSSDLIILVLGLLGRHPERTWWAYHANFVFWVGLAQGMVVFAATRSEEHTSELQSRLHLVCRLLLEKKKTISRYDQRRVTRPSRRYVA